MEINISNDLKNLAKAMDKPLFIVGGRVRDSIIGYENSDIDIVSELKVDDMIKICKNLSYKVDVINKRLGTIQIRPNNGECYEYTPFRKENYVKGHTPEDVEFVDDISIDASRRDFSINSIYYNVLTGEIFDPYNGVKDIEKKVVKTIETPEKVFSSDGLRILRLVRFASVLGFKIDKKTLITAKEMMYMLKDISAERKKKELDQLVVAEEKHNVQENKFIDLFNKLNIYKYLFGLPLNKYKIKKNKDYKNYFKLSSDKRFIGFIMLFLLNKYNFKYMPQVQVEFDINNILGRSLRCSNDEIKQAKNCYLVLQELRYNPLNNFTAVNYQKLTDQEKLIVNSFVDVKPVSMLLINMINSGIPVSENKLNISNEDIINLLGEKYISKVKRLLMEACLLGKVNNVNEELINFIEVNILQKK